MEGALQTFGGRRVIPMEQDVSYDIINETMTLHTAFTTKKMEHSIPGAPGGSICVKARDFFNEGGYDAEFLHSYSPEDLGNVTEAYNTFYNLKDLYFMSFHPDDPATVEDQEFLVNPGKDHDDSVSYPMYSYSMMLVQKFSQLQEASDKLHRMGYYKRWPKNYYNEVVKSRYEKYNKLFGGTYGSKKEIKKSKEKL